jgi:plastocyanin
MRNHSNKNIRIYLYLVIVSTLCLSIGLSYSLTNDVLAQPSISAASDNVTNLQSNISAESIFNTKTMTLGNNVQTLVILIPNEGHHAAGEDDEARFLDQHFVPENAVINAGTTVLWFNGDVGHERTIDLKDTSSNTVFNTGEIIDSQASQPFTFSNVGTYNYEAEGDPGVIMTGSVTVDNIQSPVISSSANASTSNIDTVGVLMVPTQDIDEYISQITSAGITVDSTYDFQDLRGGQEGTGDVQTLIVWTTGGKDFNETLSSLSELSSNLPYS